MTTGGPLTIIHYRHYELLTDKGITLGQTIHKEPVSLDPDALERHLLILGKTGTGKSNLLLNIIQEIIESDLGSVAIFDPHGDLGKMVATMLPDRSVIISPRQVESNGTVMGIQFNAIAPAESDLSGELAASWIRDVFSSEGVFSQGTWGPRLEVIFTSVLNEIIRTRDDANLGDLLELLTDIGKMRRFVSGIEDDYLKSFLKTQIADWKGWNQYASSSVNKILPLLTNRGVRGLISSRSDSFDLTKALDDEPKVLIPEIWKDLVPEETYKILTVLILLKIWVGRLGSNNRKPLYLVFDEAQLVPNGIMDRLLREGRKFGLRVIMATQFLGSTLNSLSETLRGNVSNVISYTLFEKDAEIISGNYFWGQVKERLSLTLKAQAIHTAVVWTHGEEGIIGPLSFYADFVNREIDEDTFRKARTNSILKYGSPVKRSSLKEAPSDLHEFLITELQKYLEQRSIGSDRNLSVEGLYPDLFFTYRAITYFVEVEVSDLVNFGRIWKKILDYAGRPLVFLTPPGYSEQLYKKLLDRIVESRESELEHGDILGSTSILEYDKGFQFYASGRLRQLRMDYLQEGSFMKSLEEARHSQIRHFIYSKMLKTQAYSMEFPLDEVGRTFGASNAESARSYLCGESGNVTIRNLFGVSTIDS